MKEVPLQIRCCTFNAVTVTFPISQPYLIIFVSLTYYDEINSLNFVFTLISNA